MYMFLNMFLVALSMFHCMHTTLVVAMPWHDGTCLVPSGHGKDTVASTVSLIERHAEGELTQTSVSSSHSTRQWEPCWHSVNDFI